MLAFFALHTFRGMQDLVRRLAAGCKLKVVIGLVNAESIPTTREALTPLLKASFYLCPQKLNFEGRCFEVLGRSTLMEMTRNSSTTFVPLSSEC